MSSSLRVAEGVWLELDHTRVARLVPGLPPTVVFRLEEALECSDDIAIELDDLEVENALLKEKVQSLEEQLAKVRR